MNAPAFPDLSARDAQAIFERVAGNIEQVMHGQHETVRRLLAAFAAGGDVILDEVRVWF
jgi:MoxR-like ATPase